MVLYSVVAVEHEASYSMNSDVDKGQTLMLISARHVKSHELRRKENVLRHASVRLMLVLHVAVGTFWSPEAPYWYSAH